MNLSMTKKKKVLLAEDDADDRDFFTYFLKDRDDLVLLPPVEDGLQILKFLNAITDPKELPDLILLDQNMPKMNGRETLKQLKLMSAYAHIPVFIYSTYAEKNMMAACVNSGAVMVSQKPTNRDGYNLMMDNFLKSIQHHVFLI